MISFKQTVPPSAEPVTLADAKTHARIDASADDTLITELIKAAREWVEQYTGRALITQTWQLWLDIWPLEQYGDVVLPRAPLQSVSSIQTFDDTDTGTVWAASNYFVDTIRAPGRIALRSGASWPVPTRLTNGIRIEYIAGYGNDGSTVPEAIKTAIRQLVAHWYENRGEATISVSARGWEVPLVIQALLDPYRIRHVGI